MDLLSRSGATIFPGIECTASLGLQNQGSRLPFGLDRREEGRILWCCDGDSQAESCRLRSQREKSRKDPSLILSVCLWQK